ncbi:MAG: MaoC family dehydratase [Lachnospiraceae bacterium]|nr:MaoC family dehydratase [Lachnospiraceae bacterium]
MNRYGIGDLFIGQKESFQVVVTEEMMEAFYRITKDENPLHRDPEYAAENGYSQPVAYGMLTASFLSTLAGVYLPGEKSLIQSVELKFVKPVFSGDELTVTGEVTEIHESVRQIVLKTVITNRENVKVLKGIIKIGVRDERE